MTPLRVNSLHRVPFSPLRPTKIQWSILLAAAALLAYLLLGLEVNKGGWRTLPDADGSTVDILKEMSPASNVEEVASAPEAAWEAWKTKGFAPSRPPAHVVWARVILRNPGADPWSGVLADAQHFADKVERFSRGANAENAWRREKSGEWTPAIEKPIWGRENAFPVFVPGHGEKTLYLRYEDAFGIWLDIHWWPKQGEFYAGQLRAMLAEGLYFGTLLALLFYNIMLWVRIRLPALRAYLSYIASFAIFVFFARSMPQVLEWPLGSPWMEALLDFFFACSSYFLLRFVEEFLELGARLPRLSRKLRWLQKVMLGAAVLSISSPLTGFQTALTYVTLAASMIYLVVFLVTLAARRAGSPQATYITLAFAMLLFGFAPPLASQLKWLSVRDASRAVMAGSALEMLLLAVAMSDRIGLLQQEKIAAQRELLKEAEQRETLQEAYADDLALEVRERTEELERANADKDRILAVLGHDLRSPLTGLTRSAEHWASQSVDPATWSAFAQQAAQTGRSLLLLIEDLVMWARLRAGSGLIADHALAALIPPVLALHRFQALDAKIRLDVRMPDDAVVRTDLVPIQALMRNLISNALKAARSGVEVEAFREQARIRIAVRDDGPGLPMALSGALRENNPEALPLTHGLGLRLCMEISRALDLQLGVISSDNAGTEFRFYLTIPPP